MATRTRNWDLNYPNSLKTYIIPNITASIILALLELGEVSQNTRNMIYIARINNLFVLEQARRD